MSELTIANTTYTSDSVKSYGFNTDTELNSQLVTAFMSTDYIKAERRATLILEFLNP